jgi:hypothetical protein
MEEHGRGKDSRNAVSVAIASAATFCGIWAVICSGNTSRLLGLAQRASHSVQVASGQLKRLWLTFIRSATDVQDSEGRKMQERATQNHLMLRASACVSKAHRDSTICKTRLLWTMTTPRRPCKPTDAPRPGRVAVSQRRCRDSVATSTSRARSGSSHLVHHAVTTTQRDGWAAHM